MAIVDKGVLTLDESSTPYTIDFPAFPVGSTNHNATYAPVVINFGAGYADSFDYFSLGGNDITARSAQITIRIDGQAEPSESLRYDYSQQYFIGATSYDVTYRWTITIPANTAAVHWFGTPGDDTFAAAGGDDVLVSFAGIDTLSGNDGNDYLYLGDGGDIGNGGAGVDVLLGEAGNDTLNGGDDQDYLFGGDGNDTLNGGAGVDVMIAGVGDDVMNGGTESDYFYGEDGNDTGNGGDGNDIFVMVAGNDIANGDAGQDYFYMGDGDDTMNGGAGVDVMLGEAGNDTFNGGLGVDYLFLGPTGAGDNDTVVLDKVNTGVEVVYGFEAGGSNDTLRLVGSGLTTFQQVQSNISDFTASGGFCILTLDADTSVWFIGVAPGQLTSADFVFA